VSTERLDDTAPAWPNQTEAADILRTSESALLRSPVKIVTVSAGREKRISPESMIDLALHYKRVAIPEVVGRLLELGHEKYPEALGALETRIDEYVSRRSRPQPVVASQVRELLERSLSPRMLRQVLGAIERAPMMPGESATDEAETGRSTSRKSQTAAAPKVPGRRAVRRA
jgi:hypothetical protein